MFERWVSGQYVELKANPYYHLGPVNIDKVIIRTYQDTKVMAAAWENKDIDWLAAIPTEDIERVMRDFAGTSYFREIPNHGYDYISINMDHPILADPNVRMALTVGLDREAMVNTVLERRGLSRCRGHWPDGCKNQCNQREHYKYFPCQDIPSFYYSEMNHKTTSFT